MINQIGDLKLNIDQTGEMVWVSEWVRVYATRDDDPWDGWVNLRVWAKDENGYEYESSGDGFSLSAGSKAEQMAEYIRVITAIEEATRWPLFWEDEVKHLDGFLADVFSQKINKFLVK